MVTIAPVYAQYYDLSVGVERHYDQQSYLDAFPRTPIEGINVMGIERIIDEIEIDSQVWAVVEWMHWFYYDQPGGTHLVLNTDTLYYRMDGSVLYEYIDSESVSKFDFKIEIGDSIYSKFAPYLSSGVQFLFDEIQNYGGVILFNDTLTFPNGESYRVIWGDGSSSGPDPHHPIPSYETFVHEILIELEGWYYPYNPDKADIYNPFLPFFFVEGIGSIYNIFNHRGYYLAGYISTDGYAMGKLNVVPTSIDENDEIPSSVTLHQNYPNPFNPSTVIGYQLPEAGMVRLAVYDILGRHIVTLVEETQPPGTHQVRWDASRMASGIYIYRIQAGNFTETRKMVLIK